MCSISGITWESSSLVEAMNQSMLHRGPDGTAVKQLVGATLGHNRLSIIDPDPRSNQPMQTRDGRYSVVYNGEIYNFKELRAQLQKTYQFITQSDTEVIMAGYIKWGEDLFSRLNGMYALAIHDNVTGRIVLARDPVGMKPLYITKTPKGYAFASEIKALLALGISRVLDTDAFGTYMHTLYVPGPKTMLEGIEKFPKGALGIIEGAKISIKPFTYHATATKLDASDSFGLKNAVMEAVKRQMISDRPLGVYLSGGIDSSAILASAMAAGGSMDTFSVGFELSAEEEQEKFNADSVLARRLAEHFGARHHEVFIAPKDVAGVFESAAYQLDEPIGNATVVAQKALAQYARQSVVVALTGDGGDEVFGGYPRYLISRRMDLAQHIVPASVLRALPFEKTKKLSTESVLDRLALFHFQKDWELSDLLVQVPPNPSIDILGGRDIMEADRNTWLVDEALLRSDKLAMAHGLETRAPLLDLELMHQVSGFPFSKQVSLFDTKVLLKRAYQDVLPEWLLNQPKRGWFSPGAKWLCNPTLQPFVDEVLSEGFSEKTNALFNWDGIQRALIEHRAVRAYRAPALINILMFQLWAKRYDVSLR